MRERDKREIDGGSLVSVGEVEDQEPHLVDYHEQKIRTQKVDS